MANDALNSLSRAERLTVLTWRIAAAAVAAEPDPRKKVQLVEDIGAADVAFLTKGLDAFKHPLDLLLDFHDPWKAEREHLKAVLMHRATTYKIALTRDEAALLSS